METNLGYVVLAENISAKPLKEVRAASETAGLEVEVRDVKARSAFIRSVHGLKAKGAIEQKDASGILEHKLQDDQDKIVFQFSRYFVEQSGATYDNSAVISFDKESGLITCQNTDIKRLAESLFGDAQKELKTSDINSYVQRVIKKANTRRILIRDGVYFLSEQQKELVQKLKKFYTALDFTFMVLPVNHSSGEGENVVKAVIRDFKNSMKMLADEVSELEKSGELTPRIAKNRIDELHAQLKEYRELAVSLRSDLGSICTKAGKASSLLIQATSPIETLIEQVQTGQCKLQPVIGKLFVAAELLQPEFVERFSEIDIELPQEPVKVALSRGSVQGVDIL